MKCIIQWCDGQQFVFIFNLKAKICCKYTGAQPGNAQPSAISGVINGQYSFPDRVKQFFWLFLSRPINYIYFDIYIVLNRIGLSEMVTVQN